MSYQCEKMWQKVCLFFSPLESAWIRNKQTLDLGEKVQVRQGRKEEERRNIPSHFQALMNSVHGHV